MGPAQRKLRNSESLFNEVQWNESTKQYMVLQYAHLVLSKGSMEWTKLHRNTSLKEAVCGREFISVCRFVYLVACSTDCINLQMLSGSISREMEI